MRLALKLFLVAIKGALTSAAFFAVAVIANYSCFRDASFYMTCLFGLFTLLLLADLVLRVITLGRWSLGADTAGDCDGIIGSFNFSIAAYLGSLVVYGQQLSFDLFWRSPDKCLSYLALATGGGAVLCWGISFIETQAWWLHRFWMPENIRKAIYRGRDSFKQREPIIKQALVDFVKDLDTFVEAAESRGEHSTQLIFESERSEQISYGMNYNDLGWPRMRWDSTCDDRKFVSRACWQAKYKNVSAEVVLADDKQRYCLELSW